MLEEGHAVVPGGNAVDIGGEVGAALARFESGEGREGILPSAAFFGEIANGSFQVVGGEVVASGEIVEVEGLGALVVELSDEGHVLAELFGGGDAEGGVEGVG